MENWLSVLKLAPESAHGHRKTSHATRREAHMSWLSWLPSRGTGERVMRRNKCNHLLSKKRKSSSFSFHLPASEPKGMLLPIPRCAVPSKCHWTLAPVTKEEIASRDYSADSRGHKQPNFPQRQAVYTFCYSEPSARNWIFANKRRLGQDINPASAAHSCCPLKESPDTTFLSHNTQFWAAGK